MLQEIFCAASSEEKGPEKVPQCAINTLVFFHFSPARQDEYMPANNRPQQSPSSSFLLIQNNIITQLSGLFPWL
jgi:hypothetical protein